jgi:ribonuclease T2
MWCLVASRSGLARAFSCFFVIALVALVAGRPPAWAAANDAANAAAPAVAIAQADGSPSARAGRNRPGEFDYYLLALSWSPSFCEVSRERYAHRRPDPQCGPRPYSFVVHGLWPQYERGFPENCRVPSPRIPRSLVDTMLDLMPSPRLVFHEWDSHGTCSGLSADAYFDTIRRARTEIRIPAQYQSIAEPLTVDPKEVAKAFVDANPGLHREAITVICDGKRLTGVRICMTKELRFRDCAEASRSFCRAGSVVMPPVRGARAESSDGSR